MTASRFVRSATGAIPYVLLGLLVDTGDSGHWGWFAAIGSGSLCAFLVWFGKPILQILRNR